jgi:predicted ATPase/class 3 adenylate cyclase
MRCMSCHSRNPGRATFCMKCAALLVRASAAVSVEIQREASVVGLDLARAEGERRQLTVLFCDVVDSTPLSEQLDPEELDEVHASYYEECAKVIVSRFEGHIAHRVGDGIVAHFGFPLAHEDDGPRAVRSGLGIVEGLGQLNARLQRDKGIRLTVRIGIHTGVVVVGDKATGQDAVGDTTNIASRLQNLAQPDSVVISNATYRLISGYFECRELGFRSLKGIAKPMAIYQVLHESGARTRFEQEMARGLSPLAGRDAERAILVDHWKQASDGAGQVLLVSGEPGIGKSRLIRALQEHVAQDGRAALLWLQCLAYHQNTPFFPLVEQIERNILQFAPDDTADQKLNKIEGFLAQYGFSLPEMVPLLAGLLSVQLRDPYAPSNLLPDRQKLALMDAVVQAILVRAEQQPLLFVVEDLHWIDPSTRELLTLLIKRVPSARLLVVLSFRPEFIPPWTGLSHVTRMNLGRLLPEASTAIVSAIAGGKALPSAVHAQLLDKTEGVPLFVEELTKFVLESGLLQEADGKLQLTRPLPPLAIPSTLVDSLTARLDRLANAKFVAQLGAVIGREFSYELLQAVVDAISPVVELTLRSDLERLVDAQLLFKTGDKTGTSFTFRHALIQDAAYGTLLRRTRQRYHERIAKVLVNRFPTTVKTNPELVAHHHAEAGLVAESIPHWLEAGQRALGSSANLEAIAHLTRGRDALKTLAEGPEKTSQELSLSGKLGRAYMATKGYAAAEVEACFRRAQELCQQIGNPPELASVLHGLWTYHITRAQHRAALELAQGVLDLGESAQDPVRLIWGAMDVGWSQFIVGRLAEARKHLERAKTIYEDQQHRREVIEFNEDPAASGSGSLAQTLWLLGYPEQALRVSQEQLALLRGINKPYNLAFGLVIAGYLRQYLGDPRATWEAAEKAIELAEDQGAQFALITAMATILRGWALTRQGAIDEGLAQMRRGLTFYRATGAALVIPYWNWLLAQVCGEIGRHREGLELLTEAEELVNLSEERYWEAEIHRLRGDILAHINWAAETSVESPESSYVRALDVARRQGAKSLELRAAMSLACLWRQQGKSVEARQLLAATYNWFTEGLATPDLQAARKLLAELASPLATVS